MAEHKDQFRGHSTCRLLRLQRCDYYAWQAEPKSTRTLADETLMVPIKHSCEESESIYGCSRVHCDLRENVVLCEEKRIARLMRQAQLRSSPCQLLHPPCRSPHKHLHDQGVATTG